VANGKHRRKKKNQLEQEEGTIVDQENLKHYISEYYKGLLGDPKPSNISMVEVLIMISHNFLMRKMISW
jgi:hypothetical protein